MTGRFDQHPAGRIYCAPGTAIGMAGGGIPAELLVDLLAEFTIVTAVRVISDAVGERLLEEVDLMLDCLRDGTSTVEGEREGHQKFWRQRAAEMNVYEQTTPVEAPDEPETTVDNDSADT